MSPIDLNGKKFGLLSNSENGQVSTETIFEYTQQGSLVTANYKGGTVVKGSILGSWNEDNRIDLLYQCLTTEGELKAGKAQAKATLTADGRIKLTLDWQWLTADQTTGKSEYLEIR